MIEIYNEDAIKGLSSLNDDCCQLILTDIPYGEVNRKSNGLRNLNKDDADTLNFDLNDFIELCVKKSKGSIYIFCGTEQVSGIRSKMVSLGLSTRLIIWEKSNPSPMNGQYIWLSGVECCVYGKKKNAVFNAHCRNTVLKYPNGRNKLHPTEKNLDLFKDLISVSSNEGDLVIDPCIGSGTTALACKLLGRQCIGFDICAKYCEIARGRIV
jgi:DNA modification methylase